VSGSSFVLQQEYGLSQQVFGIVFGGGAAGMIAATQLNVRLLLRYSPARILISALLVGSVAGLVMLTLAVTRVGGIVGVLAPLWVVLAAVGFALPNAPALALSRHGEAAGTASAMLGAIQFGVGALAAPLVGVFGNDSVAMASVVAGGMVTAVAVLTLVARPWRLTGIDAELEPVPV
jgi:DHA1 family bicyclomycin/chloramphenicol resistance-like MFS transporter